MNQRTPEKIIPFAPLHKEPRSDGDPVDRSGQAIVGMLQEAVEVAKQNCDRAMDIAHKLSLQLRAAEDKVAQLEGDVRYYQERAVRAEKWMLRIQQEIEEKFFREGGGRNGASNGHANGHGHSNGGGNGYAPR
jgi:hypothetical protein